MYKIGSLRLEWFNFIHFVSKVKFKIKPCKLSYIKKDMYQIVLPASMTWKGKIHFRAKEKIMFSFLMLCRIEFLSLCANKKTKQF